ncbi:hypothetical protein FKP32DRAFT_1594112 [Trametes sanguinea]|nr:hypothetical protein FKP32DRAFT_1594112 [Trametes sanguinea]
MSRVRPPDVTPVVSSALALLCNAMLVFHIRACRLEVDHRRRTLGCVPSVEMCSG